MTQVEELIERLRTDASWCRGRVAVTIRQIGRDVDEAADALTSLQDRVARLEEAAKYALGVICTTNVYDSKQCGEAAKALRAALQTKAQEISE